MRFLLPLLFILTITACLDKPNSESKYLRMIGDIEYNHEIDSPDHELCHLESRAVQYYAYTNAIGDYPYVGEKNQLVETFKKLYNPETVKKESGLIRIRFLVNCKGQAGRYRIIGMDENYNKKTFDRSITDQLLSITKNEVEWEPFEVGSKKRDYYMYLIFKMKEGAIIEIMP